MIEMLGMIYALVGVVVGLVCLTIFNGQFFASFMIGLLWPLFLKDMIKDLLG